MARKSKNSLSSSLRGKIWVSTIVLAFFVCTFGLISYLVVSLLINDAFYGILIPFFFLAFTIMLFGWWLSNEVVNPIERVTLLATSLERSTSTSIPKSSGSAETDQLLQTIQKNNQQIQNIIAQMDKVASGNLDIAPVQGSDRLSAAFQKLLAKVSESIHAKEELDEIKKAVSQLKLSVAGVRSGNLDVYIGNDHEQTRELSATFKYLIENLSRLIASVQEGSAAAETAVGRVSHEIEGLIEKDEVRVQELTEASIALKQVPNLINKITEDLTGSAKSARQSIEKAQHGSGIASQNSNTVGNLRKQIREDVKRIQGLTERSHDIERVAKTVEDLANRTNMIALNASIQATEMGEDGHGFVLVAEEVERLATRANATNKQISTLNKAILAEIGKVETSVETTITEVASLSKYAIETGNVLSELERYIAQFLNLQENLIAYSKDQSEETDAAFGTFANSISETETSVGRLTSSSRDLDSLARIVKDLKSASGEFRLPEKLPVLTPAVHGNEEPEAYPGDKPQDVDVTESVETAGTNDPRVQGGTITANSDGIERDSGAAETSFAESESETSDISDGITESTGNYSLDDFHDESSDSVFAGPESPADPTGSYSIESSLPVDSLNDESSVPTDPLCEESAYSLETFQDDPVDPVSSPTIESSFALDSEYAESEESLIYSQDQSSDALKADYEESADFLESIQDESPDAIDAIYSEFTDSPDALEDGAEDFVPHDFDSQAVPDPVADPQHFDGLRTSAEAELNYDEVITNDGDDSVFDPGSVAETRVENEEMLGLFDESPAEEADETVFDAVEEVEDDLLGARNAGDELNVEMYSAHLSYLLESKEHEDHVDPDSFDDVNVN